jgi:hypothetical protein
MITNNTSTNTSLENTLDSLKLTIQGRKRWVMLVLSFLSSEADSFILWKRHGLRKFYMFGRSLSQPEARSIVNTILNRFPQYQFHNQ